MLLRDVLLRAWPRRVFIQAADDMQSEVHLFGALRGGKTEMCCMHGHIHSTHLTNDVECVPDILAGLLVRLPDELQREGCWGRALQELLHGLAPPAAALVRAAALDARLLLQLPQDRALHTAKPLRFSQLVNMQHSSQSYTSGMWLGRPSLFAERQ